MLGYLVGTKDNIPKRHGAAVKALQATSFLA